MESSLECSDEERASLGETSDSLETAVGTITTALSAVLEDLNGRKETSDLSLMSFSYRADRFNSIQ